MNETSLPRAIANRILAHALQGGRDEVCGLVGARHGTPTTVYPVPNVAADASRRFRMDPAAQIDAMRRMREAGEVLFAIYHSHPTTSAQPSPTDVSDAAYPGALYLIVSLGTRGLVEMQGFRHNGGDYSPVELAIE